MNVLLQPLSGLRETAKRWEISLAKDVWKGKPPYRYFDIGNVITSPKYF